MSKKEEIKTEVTDDDFYGLLMTVTEQCAGISDSHKTVMLLRAASEFGGARLGLETTSYIVSKMLTVMLGFKSQHGEHAFQDLIKFIDSMDESDEIRH